MNYESRHRWSPKGQTEFSPQWWFFLGLGSFKLYLWNKNVLAILYCNQFEQLLVVFLVGFTEVAFQFSFYWAEGFLSLRLLGKAIIFISSSSNGVRYQHDWHVPVITLNHLFWSQENYTGLHLVLCSSRCCLKHDIFLSSILCMTFPISPVVSAKAQFSLACIVINSDDKNVCFQFKAT